MSGNVISVLSFLLVSFLSFLSLLLSSFLPSVVVLDSPVISVK